MDGATDASKLQRVLWAPNKVKSTISKTLAHGLSIGSSVNNFGNGGKTISQGIAFVYENDLYYKPKVHTDLLCRITTTGKKHLYLI